MAGSEASLHAGAEEEVSAGSNGAAEFNGAATSLADSSTSRFTELTLDEFRCGWLLDLPALSSRGGFCSLLLYSTLRCPNVHHIATRCLCTHMPCLRCTWALQDAYMALEQLLGNHGIEELA